MLDNMLMIPKVIIIYLEQLAISFQELKGVLLDVPEIVELVGSADADRILHLHEQDGEEKAKSVLQSSFTQLMLASKETITEAVSKIKSRLHMESQVSWKFHSLLILHFGFISRIFLRVLYALIM